MMIVNKTNIKYIWLVFHFRSKAIECMANYNVPVPHENDDEEQTATMVERQHRRTMVWILYMA